MRIGVMLVLMVGCDGGDGPEDDNAPFQPHCVEVAPTQIDFGTVRMGTAPTPKSLRLRSRCHDDLNVITWRLDDPDMGFFMESKLSESILFDTGMGMGIGKGGDFRVLPRVRHEGR